MRSDWKIAIFRVWGSDHGMICIFRMEEPQRCKSEFGKEDWLMAMAGEVKKGQKWIVTLAPTGDPARRHILGKTLAWKISQLCIFFETFFAFGASKHLLMFSVFFFLKRLRTLNFLKIYNCIILFNQDRQN